jgi:CBS domain-containing protein
MKVSDVLKAKGTRVMTVLPTETVRGLVQRLQAERVGAMVVSEDGRRMSGIVSERDVVGCVALHGRNAPDVKVSEIMSKRVITCAPSDNLTVIARKMTENRIRHLPVVEGDVLAGLVSIGDVVKLRLDEMELEANVLRDLAVASH